MCGCGHWLGLKFKQEVAATTANWHINARISKRLNASFTIQMANEFRIPNKIRNTNASTIHVNYIYVCVCVSVRVEAQKGFIIRLNLFNAFSCGCAGKRFFFSLSISSHSIYVFFSFMRTIELTLSICTTKIHAVNLNFDDIQWMFRMNECVYVCVLYIKRGPENHYSFGFCAGFSCQLWFSHSENNRTHQWLWKCVCVSVCHWSSLLPRLPLQ